MSVSISLTCTTDLISFVLRSLIATGYRDIIAIPDLTTFRRIPWENDIPFFLLSFYDPNTRAPLSVCSRGVLKRVTDSLASLGWEAMCGVEFEFFNFRGNKIITKERCAFTASIIADVHFFFIFFLFG